jgi:hypothetical protein
MNNEIYDNKTIVLPLSKNEIKSNNTKSKKVAIDKPKKKRIVTDTKKWNENVHNETLTVQSQLDILSTILEQDISNSTKDILFQQIRNKIAGYLAQDRDKGLYDPEKFVMFQDILDLLRTSNLSCYYCKETVLLLYEYVREPKQWTLERLNNSYGHNCDNVVLSCLKCNLRRRTMNSDRYLKTKEMAIIVKTL